MPHLFEPCDLAGIPVRNRFVRSATWEGLATEKGAPTERLTAMMAALAEGEVGLIISSHAYVRQDGQAGPWQLGVYEDDLVSAYRQMTEAVHTRGGKIVLQLAHAGYFANPKLTRTPPLCPSLVDSLSTSPRREISLEDIEGIVKAFGEAARRARDAGFDGVQIHSAHGYLLSQFLSPAFNHRTDAYGGPIANRMRIHLAVVAAIRRAVGDTFPLLVKMNCSDFIEDGLTLQDAIQAGKALLAAGVRTIELSGGVLTGGKLSPSRMGIHTEEREAYFQEEARAFKKAIPTPLILVGGLRSVPVCERLLEEGAADFFSLCRPLIREPALVRRWRSGDLQRAKCLSDNQCFGPAMAGEGISCVQERKDNPA